jgi:uncharacterized membrane protein SpoIIM required for sporulation
VREARFIHDNAGRWDELEKVLASRRPVDPDRLSDLYIRVTDDLSYARTFYPESQTTVYLNQLAGRLHQHLYRSRKESWRRFLTFWTEEVPGVLFEERRLLAWSLAVFMAAALLGVISAGADETFVRLILQDEYVDMTLHNIERGDPMAVYKQAGRTEMFLGITYNNVMVSFRAFAFGLLAGVGSIYVLVVNGVMIGAFMHLFAEQGVLGEALRTVWIHGTLEISAIVVAGGAGLVLGRGLLFPGTLPRAAAFAQAARRGAKIVIGLVPIFVVAGFLEGYVTRLTDMSLLGAILIIGGSLAFVVWYFVLFPARIGRLHSPKPDSDGA